jgi:hypothetical protein
MLDLEAIKARCAAATPGAWKYRKSSERVFLRILGNEIGFAEQVVCEMNLCSVYAWGNTEFIIHAREDVPALIAEVEFLRCVANSLRLAANELLRLKSIKGTPEYIDADKEAAWERLRKAVGKQEADTDA